MTKKKVELFVPLTRVHYKRGVAGESRYIDPADPPESGEPVDLEHLTEVERHILVERGIYKKVN